jgi:hypothetical protein
LPESLIVNHKMWYNSLTPKKEEITAYSPSPSGRELEGGGFHPHLSPLPSREKRLLRPDKLGLAMTWEFEGEEIWLAVT